MRNSWTEETGCTTEDALDNMDVGRERPKMRNRSNDEEKDRSNPCMCGSKK